MENRRISVRLSRIPTPEYRNSNLGSRILGIFQNNDMTSFYLNVATFFFSGGQNKRQVNTNNEKMKELFHKVICEKSKFGNDCCEIKMEKEMFAIARKGVLKDDFQSVLHRLRVCFHFCFEFVETLHFGDSVHEVFYFAITDCFARISSVNNEEKGKFCPGIFIFASKHSSVCETHKHCRRRLRSTDWKSSLNTCDARR